MRTIPDANRNLIGMAPQNPTWSPDGKTLSFVLGEESANLPGKKGDIVQVDAASGKATILATAEQMDKLSSDAVNEKDRDHRARYGMSSYIWANDSKHVLLDKGGKLWLFDIAKGTGTLVVDTKEGSGDNPQFSPDATNLAYLRNHNIYVHAVNGGKETALTNTTEDTLLNGEIDWVYLEELEVRSNYSWSPDSKAIAYLQMDEAKVPVYPITDWIPTHATIDSQRYPQPGDPNPAVKVGVVSAKGGKTRFIDVPFSQNNDYIPRFGWLDANTIYIEVLTRDQQHMNLYFADAKTGKTRKVYEDRDAKYLEIPTDLHPLPNGQFLVESWRDGHTHLYLWSYDAQHPLDGDAKLVRQLTSGDYEVEGVESIDTKTGTVFYTSSEGSPMENNLWAVQLDGTNKRKLTEAHGVYHIEVSPDGQHFAQSFSNAETVPAMSLCGVGATCSTLWKGKDVVKASGVSRSFVTFTAADGMTKLYGHLTMPVASDSAAAPTAASVPLIINPYNGPTPTSMIRNGWGGGSEVFNELLAQHGFAVLDVDSRGCGGRGRDFQQAAYRNFGPVQFSDQMAVLDQVLAKYPQFDAKRVGWWGWSWGGSFTLYAMTHTDRIRAGVSVAPVTDWRNYDSIYTERYMGLPGAKPGTEDVYAVDSDVNSAAKLKGRVLIAHGTGDDNVHMANTIQFVDKLIDAGIPYDLQLFPRKTHSIAGQESRDELFGRILWQFETYLKPEASR